MSSVLRRAVVTEEEVVRAVVAAEYELRIAWARRGGLDMPKRLGLNPELLLLLDQLPEQANVTKSNARLQPVWWVGAPPGSCP